MICHSEAIGKAPVAQNPSLGPRNETWFGVSRPYVARIEPSETALAGGCQKGGRAPRAPASLQLYRWRRRTAPTGPVRRAWQGGVGGARGVLEWGAVQAAHARDLALDEVALHVRFPARWRPAAHAGDRWRLLEEPLRGGLRLAQAQAASVGGAGRGGRCALPRARRSQPPICAGFSGAGAPTVERRPVAAADPAESGVKRTSRGVVVTPWP
jgi:hypothetical protein